jgi:hypothetical protein
MGFPGVCAIAVVGIATDDAVRMVNAMAAKVENVAREKRRMLFNLLKGIERLSIATLAAKPASMRELQ